MKIRQAVARGERFEFGENWRRFLTVLSDERIREAESSLKEMLEEESLEGRSFLDVGTGSGLFSLAARRLGARVCSFDNDPQSVKCAIGLRKRYYENDAEWRVKEGSALDGEFLIGLGQFDIVYSWGVLHHTGKMWQALENAWHLVAPGGRLFISIYNDQGLISNYWRQVKRLYNRNMFLRYAILVAHIPYLIGMRVLVRAANGRLQLKRGMSMWHDTLDWLGGYPFEVASPEEIIKFYERRGGTVERIKTCGSRHGCNEFVIRRAENV